MQMNATALSQLSIAWKHAGNHGTNCYNIHILSLPIILRFWKKLWFKMSIIVKGYEFEY